MAGRRDATQSRSLRPAYISVGGTATPGAHLRSDSLVCQSRVSDDAFRFLNISERTRRGWHFRSSVDSCVRVFWPHRRPSDFLAQKAWKARIWETSSLRRSFRLLRWSQCDRAGFSPSFLRDVVFLHRTSACVAQFVLFLAETAR